jgi:hypothetical protein
VFAVIIILAAGCAGVEKQPVREVYTGPLLVSAEDPITGIPSEVEYADYWVRKVPDPDAVILTPDQIETFNRENPLRGALMFDIASMPAQSSGEQIREYLAANARYLIENPFYVTGDIQLEKAERHRIAALMDTSGVPDIIDIRFGMMIERASGKLWPTPIPLMSTPNVNEFDQGMVSTVDMGDPVALLHTSKDGIWCYVQTESFACWVPSATVAFGEIAVVRELTERSSPLVVIGDRVAVYGVPDDRAAVGWLQMGEYLPIRSVGNRFCEVLVPGRGARGELAVKRGYVRRGSDVSIGFLPYTPRNVYRQCFVLYGARYGWGGEYESRDCSSYIMDIFRCFNLRLPRNSASQAKIGIQTIPVNGMDRTARLQALRALPGGVTLLQMPGHIMIYLGEAGGKPYAVHSFWSWREGKGEGVDVTHRVARVAVTDLILGDGSSRGAFLDRLENIVVLGGK